MKVLFGCLLFLELLNGLKEIDDILFDVWVVCVNEIFVVSFVGFNKFWN